MKSLFLGISKRAVIHDTIMVVLSWYFAYWLRLDFDIVSEQMLDSFIYSLPIVLIIQISTFFFIGTWRSMWGFASLHDLISITKGCFVGCALIIVYMFYAKQLQIIPKSIFLNYLLISTLLINGSRVLIRLIKNRNIFNKTTSTKNVLIVGAGKAGEGIVRDIARNKDKGLIAKVFVDDKSKIGKEIHGIRVSGRSIDIPKLAIKFKINLIIIAVPSATPEEIIKVFNICKGTGLPVHKLPSLDQIVSGIVSIDQLKKVTVEELLYREQVAPINWHQIRNTIENKVILVTGAGGSIGKELCLQIAKNSPKTLIILDNNEFNLFEIEQDLIETHHEVNIIAKLVDLKDKIGVNLVISECNPNIIFHAAAYKHVPLLQCHIREATYNNVIGTNNIALATINNNVEKFVLVSTDKAVNPENVMGTTKKISEIICQKLNKESNTKFITVRFGNVLGSAGSVIPIFNKQLENGGPITVTHEEVTRYFMTIPEASQLILQALTLGTGGEIFVLDMGKPIKIKDLAEKMISISGKTLGKDINIKITGLRPGEKLHEELFHKSECLEATNHKKIMKAKSRRIDVDKINQTLTKLEKCCIDHNEDGIKKLLLAIVPESVGIEV